MWLEDVLVGSLASGVNGPTLALLNVALLACVLALVSLIAVFGGAYSALVPHLLALLLLCVGLAASVNWLISQTGTVAPEEQRAELFGAERPDPQGTGAAEQPATVAPEEQSEEEQSEEGQSEEEPFVTKQPPDPRGTKAAKQRARESSRRKRA